MFKALSQAFFLQNLLAKLIAWFPGVADHNIGKYFALKRAFFLTSLDGVEGDYLEFGVFTGSSFGAAIEFSKSPMVPRKTPMRFFGFDSFKGFGKLDANETDHPFYKDQNFETDVQKVTRRLQRLLKDPQQIRLVDGYFEDTLKGHAPSEYSIEKAAVVLVDCDTYSAADLVFQFVEKTLQEGTVLVIDDFFGYKGSPLLGTYGAFLNLEKRCQEFKFRRLLDYGCGGVAYMAVSNASR